MSSARERASRRTLAGRRSSVTRPETPLLPSSIMVLLDALRCVFAGGCWLALVHLSVCQYPVQRPRFIGIKNSKRAAIFCLWTDEVAKNNTEPRWFRSLKDSKEKNLLHFNDRVVANRSTFCHILTIKDASPEDSGIYYCKVGKQMGHGTELKVLRHISRQDAVKKSQTKDIFIVLQALLLTFFAVIVGGLFLREVTKEDRIYEEPEDGHLYEGLQIEHCDLYEDITAYSQPSEAPWEGPESPCEQ
ncbi:B-cell antigen receptor complex-associated protein beta chain [Arapaima gigas]